MSAGKRRVAASSAGAQALGPGPGLDAARQPPPASFLVLPGIWRLHIDRASGSVEERLHVLGEDALLVDLVFPGTRSPYPPRGIYDMGTDHVDPHRDFNGILYLERSPKMDPLRRAPCR